MILSTTPSLDGYEISDYLDVVSGEVIMGANIIRDWMAALTDVVGGRSGAYESKLQEGRRDAISEMKQAALRMGANAIIGIDIDYEVIGSSMLMVAASGTAVVAKKKS